MSLVLLAAVPLAAQNAALVGTVTDPQQAAIPNVTVNLSDMVQNQITFQPKST